MGYRSALTISEEDGFPTGTPAELKVSNGTLTDNGDGTFSLDTGGGGTTSPLTTKGDLYGYDTDNARIPVGSNGQVLTADSSQTLGLKWATVAGTGDVTAASAFGTDNVLIRSDGTGKGVQSSGISIDDTDNVAGVGTLNTHTIPGGTGTFALTSQLHDAVTVTDSSEIDFTLVGQDITASLIAGSIDETKLDTSVNASLDLADSSTQPNDLLTTLNLSATDKIIGRVTAGAGVAEELTATQVRTLINVADGANNYTHPNHSGDVTSVGDGATTIANDAVTYAKMQNVSATDKLLGRSTAGAGDVEEITCTAFARSILDDANEATFKATVNLEIGTDVQAYDADLTAIAGLASTDGNFIVGSATGWVAESGATARTSLGLAIGTDVQAHSAVLDATTASFTTTLETKLNGIEALADVTDTANVTSAGALMDSELTDLTAIKTLSAPDNTTISTFGGTLVDDATAGDARTTLGVGAIGTLSTIKDSITVIIDGGGSAITTGAKKIYITAPYDCTLTGWRLIADQSGSIVIDVWKDAYANAPATVADTMIATGTKPTLSTAQKAEDLTIDWATTTMTEGDVLEFNVDSITTVTKVVLTIFVTRAE